MTGHDENHPRDERDHLREERDYLEDPGLGETARQVRRALRAEQMRPSFRDQLRADIVAARADAIQERDARPAAPAPQRPGTGRPPAQLPAPQRPDPQHTDPQHAGPQYTGPQYAGPQYAGPQYAGPQYAGPQHPGGQRPIPQYAAAGHPGAERPGTRRPFGQSPARPPSRRRGLRRAGWLGAATAAAAAVVVFAVLGLPALRGARGPATVAIRSTAAGNVSADPAAAVRLSFTQPLDHAATEAALRLRPFTDTSPTWDGDTLVLTAAHGFAPNTGYLLTIDHAVARTAEGSALAADLHLAFGTALQPGAGPGPSTTLALHRTFVAGAADGSEAVVARDGSLLLTEAQPGTSTGNRRGLVRLTDHGAERLSGNAAAICVSRSGDSIAYLADTGTNTQVVFANGLGNAQSNRQVDIDDGSPLGWINDDMVTYVSKGELVAVDRDGHTSDLHVAVDAKGTFVIAPGGGYAYVEKRGVVKLGDHPTVTRQLTGLMGEPAFSADGATVVWIDNSTGTPRLSIAPSAGGPVFVATPQGVGAGDKMSDLSVSPDGSHLVYTLTKSGHVELRLASLPDGDTLAVSTEGAGESPNWSPAGHLFAILDTHGSPHIETVAVPQALRDRGAAIEATATAFGNAQLSGDTGAQRALADQGVTLPSLGTRPTRAAVVWVVQTAEGTTQARVRLTVDATAEQPVVRQAEETLTLGIPQGGILPKVLKVSAVQPFVAAPAGPQLVRLDTDAVPGSVLLTFDSDLDPATVNAAISLTTSSGKRLEPHARYDAQTRTVTLEPRTTGKLTLRIGTQLRDAKGNPSSTVDARVTVQG
jgi:hypothetical protein